MKKLLLAIAACIAISGCNVLPKRDPEVIIKHQFIILTAPPDLLAIPAQVPKVDTTKDNDLAIGNWLIDNEKRSLEIEGKLKGVKTLQDQRLEDLKKLPKDSVIIR